MKRFALICLWVVALSGCANTHYVASEDYELWAQNHALELASDVRVVKLVDAYRRGSPKAREALEKAAAYLHYGKLSVRTDGLILQEQDTGIVTPVNMERLVALLTQMYAAQDARRQMQTNVSPYAPY